MGVHYGNRPSGNGDYVPYITSGLILNYDISSSTVYPGTGTSIYDLSGNSITGSLVNSPTYSNGTLTTNGTNSYILSGDTFSKFTSTSVTLEVWVKTVSDNGVVVTEQGTLPVNSGWHDSQIEIVSGSLKVSVWKGSQFNLSIGAVTRNVWQHYVMTYNSATSTITGYLNATTSNSTTGTRQAPNTSKCYYGLGLSDSTNLGDGTYLAATYGSFRVYNKALSSAEVLQNFNLSKSKYGI